MEDFYKSYAIHPDFQCDEFWKSTSAYASYCLCKAWNDVMIEIANSWLFRTLFTITGLTMKEKYQRKNGLK